MEASALKPVNSYTKQELIKLKAQYEKWTKNIADDYKFIKEDIAHLDSQIGALKKQNQMLSIRRTWAQKKQIKKNKKRIRKLNEERAQLVKNLNSKGVEYKSQKDILVLVNNKLDQSSGKKSYSKKKTWEKKKRYKKSKMKSQYEKGKFKISTEKLWEIFSKKVENYENETITIGSWTHPYLTKRNVSYAGGGVFFLFLLMILRRVLSG